MATGEEFFRLRDHLNYLFLAIAKTNSQTLLMRQTQKHQERIRSCTLQCINARMGRIPCQP